MLKDSNSATSAYASPLKNAVVFVTGAGKGIGEAFVLNLLQIASHYPDLKLFITARTDSDLKRLNEHAKSANVPCAYLASDLAERPLVALEACIKTYGRVDALIHSAGVGRFGDFLTLTRADLEFVMKTNVEASFLLMQAVYAQMKKQTPKGEGSASLRGQIQWVTSVAAEIPFEQSSIYCMSKFAQRGLIEVMREYAHKDRIRICEVKPGATLTPMWGQVVEEQVDRMMAPLDIALPMLNALELHPRASLESITLRPIAGDL